MGKKAFFRLSLAVIALGAGVFVASFPASAAEGQLFWSPNSALTNQSTEALRDGRHAHAIRFARDVLRSKTHAANQLIARHNLCLAYLAQGKGAEAKEFCDLVLGAEARYPVVEKDGRLTVDTDGNGDVASTTLQAAARASVARAQGGALAEIR